MEICSLNSYNPFQPVQKNSPDKKQTSKNKISGEKVLNYLNYNGIYNISFGKKPPRAIYAIDKNGDYVRYDSVSEAAKNLNCTTGSNISKCANNQKGTCADHTFIYADEVEHIEKNGTISVDTEKIKEKQNALTKALKKRPVIRPFYAIDKEGNYKKFDRICDAAKDLKITSKHIPTCLSKKRSSTGGYAFIYADEIEYTASNGKKIVDTRLSPEQFDKTSPVAIYSINNKGEIRYHKSISSIEKELGIRSRNIYTCLDNANRSANGYSFVRAKDVLIQNEENKEIFDNNVLNERFQHLIKNAVYIIDKEGNYKRYENTKDAGEALGVKTNAISLCISGVNTTVKEHLVIKAGDVESLKSGKLSINTKMLRRCGQEAIELERSKHVVAIRKEDNFRKEYSSIREAAKDLNISPKNISSCLRGERKITHGYRFKHLPEHTPKTKKEPANTQDIIYSIFNGIDIREFKDIDEAAKRLNLEVKDIEYFLRRGRTKEGKSTLKGYVFATGKDE